MLSKLNNTKYNNICKKFIEILNKTKLFFKKEIKENTKAFIYQSKMEDLLTYRFTVVSVKLV